MCQNATLLEITCHGSYVFSYNIHAQLPSGSRGLDFGLTLIYTTTLYLQVAKPLVRQRVSAGLSVPLLLVSAIKYQTLMMSCHIHTIL